MVVTWSSTHLPWAFIRMSSILPWYSSPKSHSNGRVLGEEKEGFVGQLRVFLRPLSKVFFEVLPELNAASVVLCDFPLLCKLPELAPAHFINVIFTH